MTDHWLRIAVGVIATIAIFAAIQFAKSVFAPVACALGVLEAGFFGLFDVVTTLAHRNKGYATMMLSSMLGWACANGAVHAYLAVVEANAAARTLYGKLGYQEAYTYWYRVPTP